MSRELLERCRRLVLTSNSTNEFTKETRTSLLKDIEGELKKPTQEPEPDYWHVVGEQGESIFVASFKEACHDHINDALIGASYYPEAEVATWVVRPLWSKPQVQPTRLTDEEILMRWAGSDTVRPVLGKNKVLRFAREIERHYKPLDT